MKFPKAWKRCPIVGCRTKIRLTWLMCRPHWMACMPANRRAHQALYREAKEARRPGEDPIRAEMATNRFHDSCDARIAEAAAARPSAGAQDPENTPFGAKG